MKTPRNALILAAMALTWLVILYASPLPQKPAASTPPDFAFTDIKGTSAALHDFKGNVILVHFWASWCTPCLKEFPELVDLASQHPEKLRILTISVDRKQEAIEKFIAETLNTKELPENLRFIHDADMNLAHKIFQSFSYPETYIIDCAYLLRDKVIGTEPDWPGRLAPYLAACP